MEAVVENMWRDILSSAQGGDLWKEKCRLAVACVQKASDAAAKEAGQPYRVITTPAINPARETEQPPPIAERQAWGLPTLPPAKWEIAWNDSSNFSKASISNRAKIAWIKAWEEACKANDRYIPLISQGVAKYVTMNLPSTTPEVLQFETDPTVIKGMVKALIPIKGSSTSSLQDWVKGRIIEHCQRVTKLTAGTQQPNKTEFEDTMYDIWACTVNCLSDVARTKTISG
ncbi:polysaccharide lyase family 8 protein [Rhizoctonia solani]|uniref:Polysaccharide lyase family 8 protein n=1 Tax=Rhizoctonia solani TaxID=456999 RepID=A0A8H8P0Y3_9AGAM|nr:polysaccharide lyase family 8 protein [Rhizoctonia solani]QRW23716.1 polysaccharide lyase family 8 protein [Rhizoctonia solani]